MLRTCYTLALVLFCAALPAVADEPYIAGFENSEISKSLKGAVLVDELNCAACHQVPETFQKSMRRAPRLQNVGARVNPYYIEAFLAAPGRAKPGTTMPDVLGHLPKSESAESAKALTHYLLSLGKAGFQPDTPDGAAVERGETLFHEVGCVACHSPRDAAGAETMADDSIPLGALEGKYRVKSLSDFLKNTHKVRPGGRMPDMRLQGRQYDDIANYLLKNTRTPGHLKYVLYQGKVWEGLDINVEKRKAGHANDFGLAQFGNLAHNSCIIFDGYLNATQAGEYTFFVELNGGDLHVNGKAVIELKPHHHRGPKKVEGKAQLKAGWNTIQLKYFHMGRKPKKFTMELAGPGLTRAPIPSSMLSISTEPIPAHKPSVPDADLIAKGRDLFVKMRCVSCHDDVKVANAQPPPTPPALAKTRTNAGCLSGKAGNWPDFRLSDSQRSHLQELVTQVPRFKMSPAEQIDKTLASMNCIACHARDGVGKISTKRDEYFIGEHKELGNEGRIPPPLTGVGAKLQRSWLEAVLLHGHRQRKYVKSSMPNFGGENVGHLVDLFESVDTMRAVTFDAPADVAAHKEAGRKMVGGEGFTCIACHDFNGQKSAAGGLELIDIPARLEKDWFYNFMLNPAHFRPGIVMPPYWPGGKSLRQDILGGDSKKQIDAIWTYLQDGKKVKAPVGLSRQASELRVADETVMVRGRGTKAGYRGIGVGYPNGINLGFDSEQMSLMYLWKGDFAATRTGGWSMRGEQRIEFEPGIPFHRLKAMDELWPYKRKTDYLFPHDHGYQYRGYYLNKGKSPTFMYEYGEVAVEDFFADTKDGATAYFQRTIRFDAKTDPAPFHFRAGTGNSVEKIDDTTFKVDRLTLKSSRPGLVRESGPKKEVLIPLDLKQGKSELTVEYRW
jgi:cytochrome c553